MCAFIKQSQSPVVAVSQKEKRSRTKQSREPGTIRLLPSGKFQVRVTVGPTPDGRQCQRSLGQLFTTRKEAELALRHHNTDRERGVLSAPSEITLAEYFPRVLRAREMEWVPKTIHDYGYCVEHYILPILGRKKMQSFKSSDARDLYRELVKRGFSRSVLKQVRTLLNMVFDEAMQEDLVPRNVVRLANFPTIKSKGSGRALTPAEVKQFMASAAPHSLFFMLKLALITGLRRGEICGLSWGDINLHLQILQVRIAIAVVSGRATAGKPKTPHSQRTVPLAAETVEMLRQHQAAQQQQGLPTGTEDPVFTTSRKTRPHPDTLTHCVQRIAQNAGLGRVRMHDLRHTCASLARRQGVPIEVVSRNLGHADARITLQLYRQVYEDERQGHALGLSELLATPK